ncbi:DUF1003 domain-containing protein [Kushneria konosiri]|uniref:DUF1003 domain-containing protein n=1 Tax=Kushneria konosiri TaxID=698828 RepID=A0A2Z2H4V5_9GAMM|nr:DUF1003 domain-containing protein [Kushneria konosiri]ARS52248.1 hypothetical protein B9G99_04605 [Kushneria konosiri]
MILSRPSSERDHAAPACHLCGRRPPEVELTPQRAVRSALHAEIEALAPGWQPGCYICHADLARVRRHHLRAWLHRHHGDKPLDQALVAAIERDEPVSRPPEEVMPERAGFGDRAADRLASLGGSWGFILSFSVLLIGWMAFNTIGLLARPFDPYPFILLNLVLSSLAALQAPVIMMSQRRQEEKDRARAESDYRINLMAELEIRQLHDKLDHALIQLAEAREHQQGRSGQGGESKGVDAAEGCDKLGRSNIE